LAVEEAVGFWLFAIGLTYAAYSFQDKTVLNTLAHTHTSFIRRLAVEEAVGFWLFAIGLTYAAYFF